MRRAVHRIATDADASGLADAARSQLPDRFVSQRAAARDNSDVAFLVNVAGRDADAATAVRILAVAGRDNAGTVRSDEPRLGVALQRALHFDQSAHGNAFRDGDNEFESGVRAFENRIGGEGRRNENRARRRAGLFHRVGDGVENWNSFAAVLKELSAFARRDAGDDLRAVINGELRVLRAKAAGDALDENLGVGFNEDGHDFLAESVVQIIWVACAMHNGHDLDFLADDSVVNGIRRARNPNLADGLAPEGARKFRPAEDDLKFFAGGQNKTVTQPGLFFIIPGTGLFKVAVSVGSDIEVKTHFLPNHFWSNSLKVMPPVGLASYSSQRRSSSASSSAGMSSSSWAITSGNRKSITSAFSSGESAVNSFSSVAFMSKKLSLRLPLVNANGVAIGVVNHRHVADGRGHRFDAELHVVRAQMREASSKFSTSIATEQPSGLGLKAGNEPSDNAHGPNSYSTHWPCSESWTTVGFKPSTPS